MVTIRKARPTDNNALLEIQYKSPQGTYFVLGMDSSPDFFNRTKPYEDGYVFVAEENEKVLGSISCAFFDTVVAGILCKASYGYGLMVDPLHRRRGIASQLQEQMNKFIKEKGVDLHFVIIGEGNIPSINLVKKHGYTHLNDFLRISVLIHEGKKPLHPEYIRQMEDADAGNVVDLLNDYYRGFDLYKPFTEESLMKEIDRYPYFNIEDVFLYEDKKGLQACLGCWNYDEITRFQVFKLPEEILEEVTVTILPFIPKLGAALSHYFANYPAFRDEPGLTDLIRYTNQVLHQKKVHFMSFPVNAETPIHNLLKKFPNFTGSSHIYVKHINEKKLSKIEKNHLYVETAHL